MALAASPVPRSIQEPKLLPFNSSGKNEGHLWDSYESASSHDQHGEDGSNLASMEKTLDQQQEVEEHDKHYPPPASGLSRNASFDSVNSHDSCTLSFSTGSPVTVLPPLTYTTCGGTGMDISSSTMSNHAAGGWSTNNVNNTNKRSASSELEAEEQQQQTVYTDFAFPEQMLLSEECDQLLASTMGTFPPMMEFPPFTRFGDQPSGSNCNDFAPGNELEYFLSSSHRTSDSSQQQVVVKSPESVGNNNVHTPSPVHQLQQQEFCHDYLVQSTEVYSGHNSRRSDSSLLSPPSARRRLSWTDSQVPEPQRHSSISEGIQQYGLNSQALEHHHQWPRMLPMVDNQIGGVRMNPFDSSSCTVEDPMVVAGGSLKRSYSAMMMQQPVPSTCSISSDAPAPSFSTTSTNFLNLGEHFPMAPVPNIDPILPPPVTNLSRSNSTTNQPDVAAFSALLYKTQGSSTGEMMQHLQQIQVQATCSSDSVARPLPPPKLRRRHGTATDPQSIAARTRRERFSDRIRTLQSLVPNGERLDTVSMLGHTLEYVRFLQHQVWQLYNGNNDAAPLADSESKEKWKEFMNAQTVVA